jgi:hypothetical protein
MINTRIPSFQQHSLHHWKQIENRQRSNPTQAWPAILRPIRTDKENRMSQRTAIVAAAAVTAFVLVLAGGVAALLTLPQANAAAPATLPDRAGASR